MIIIILVRLKKGLKNAFLLVCNYDESFKISITVFKLETELHINDEVHFHFIVIITVLLKIFNIR